MAYDGPKAQWSDCWTIEYGRRRGLAAMTDELQKGTLNVLAKENPAAVQQLLRWCADALLKAGEPLMERETDGGAE